MKRREFITLLGGAATWPLAARAQQLDRMRRMGVLIGLGADDPEAQSRAAALEKGLQDAGWIKDRNLRIEYRWADSPDALRTHITELIGMAPDLIPASSTPVIVALKEQHARVPIVFVQVTDPLGEGLVASLAHPGGHLTGFTSFEFSIGTKWLELLKQVAPRVRRVALIYNPQTAPFADLFLRPIQAAASSFAIMPVSIGARSFAEIEGTVDYSRANPTAPSWSCRMSALSTIAKQSLDLPRATACPRFIRFVCLSRAAACCRTGPTRPTFIGARPLTLIEFSRARDRLSCRCRRRQNTSSPSTSRLPRRSGSTFPRRSLR